MTGGMDVIPMGTLEFYGNASAMQVLQSAAKCLSLRPSASVSDQLLHKGPRISFSLMPTASVSRQGLQHVRPKVSV